MDIIKMLFNKYLFGATLGLCSIQVIQGTPAPLSNSDSCFQLSLNNCEKQCRFFDFLLFENQFAYTVFGDKPMQTVGIFKRKTVESVLFPTSSDLFLSEWLFFKNTLTKLKLNNFLFVVNENEKILQITLINKKEFLKTIVQHQELFNKILGVNKSPEALLQEFEVKHDPFSEVLNKSHLLYGLLLGYGLANAEGFEKRFKHGQFFLRPLSHFHSEKRDLLRTVHLPYFMVEPNETAVEKLRCNYEETRREICKVHNSDDWLKVVFDKLTQ